MEILSKNLLLKLTYRLMGTIYYLEIGGQLIFDEKPITWEPFFFFSDSRYSH